MGVSPAEFGTVRKRPYHTWTVFALALGLLLGLMLVPAITALRRSEQIYQEVRANQEQFQESQRVLEGLTQNTFAISIHIREFLLDNSPEADRVYLSRLHTSWEQLQSQVAQLKTILPPGEIGVRQKLERELGAYWASILPVFRWTPEQRAERGAYFLREEQRPRRQSVLAIAGELAGFNRTLYLQQQKRIQESERQFRSDLQWSVFYAVLAGIAVSAAGIFRIRQLERRAQQQHERAEQTSAEMRSLSVQLRQAQEEERRTISRELHDEVGQMLTAMRMELGTLDRLRASDSAEFGAAVAQLKGLAERSLRLIRDIAAGLRPSLLDDLGLGPALQKQAREFSKRTGTPVSVTLDGSADELSDRQRTYVYRIVQEALTNCSKHAHSHHVSIQLSDRNGATELTVVDDGIGFDPAQSAHSGLGLIGIEERVRELGGTIRIQSSPGHGTSLHVTIPANGKLS
jgi:signal transduction histidine kinase